MNKLKLLLFAISPLIIGYLFNYSMFRFNLSGRNILIISMVFFIYWYIVGFRSANYSNSIKESLLIGNSFASVNLLLIVYQSVVLKKILFNIVGFIPQMFFLPAISVTARIEYALLPNYMPLTSLLTFILAFILMLTVYYMGYRKSL